MEALSYQPHSGKYSPFPHDGLLPTSKFRTPSSSNLAARQSSIPNQSQPSNGVPQLREADDVDGDESSDDELPLLPKLLSPTTTPSGNPSHSHSLNTSVRTAWSSASTPPDLMSAPRRLINYPKWSLFQYPPAQASTPKIHAEANNNSQENPVVIDDDKDGDLTARSNHTSPQMTVDDPGLGCENTDGDAGGAAHTGEGVANSDLDDTAMPQGDDRSAIATSGPFSPEIPESDSAATWDEEVQGDPTPSPSGKQSRSLSGSGRPDGRGSDWVFDVFAEDDGGTEGDGSPPSKRARASPPPLKAAENRPSPAAAVTVEGVQVPGSAFDYRSPLGDQVYEVHQVVGESGSEYEVSVLTKIWLPKASVHPKLVKKYRAEQRAATRVRTRWSSRLRNKN